MILTDNYFILDKMSKRKKNTEGYRSKIFLALLKEDQDDYPNNRISKGKLKN